MQPINTALASFGMSGRLFHAPFLHYLPQYNLSAVWERSKSEAAQKYPQIHTHRTLEELLENDAVELLVVNTPNYTHYPYTKAALLAGKHVVVEKPFVVTEGEGAELISLAQEKGRILTVYHNRRFDADFRTVKKVLQQNILGELIEAEFHFDRYKEALSPKVHKEAGGPGTGALYDLGSHIIDQALQLFGMPDAVFADIRIVRPHSVVDDYFELLLYYPTLRVRLHCSYITREPLPAYILHGRQGSFLKNKTNVQEEALEQGTLPGTEGWGVEPESEKGLLHTEIDGRIVKEHITSERGNYADFFVALYHSIREGAAPPVPATEALSVIKIIEAAFESSRAQKVVALK